MKEKQIEEMARIMDSTCADCCDCNCIEKANRCTAEAIYNAGYRKQIDVAREIFEEIDGIMKQSGHAYFAIKKIAELKKKYTEEQIDDR